MYIYIYDIYIYMIYIYDIYIYNQKHSYCIYIYMYYIHPIISPIIPPFLIIPGIQSCCTDLLSVARRVFFGDWDVCNVRGGHSGSISRILAMFPWKITILSRGFHRNIIYLPRVTFGIFEFGPFSDSPLGISH